MDEIRPDHTVLMCEMSGCHKAFRVRHSHYRQRFCSPRCAMRYRWAFDRRHVGRKCKARDKPVK